MEEKFIAKIDFYTLLCKLILITGFSFSFFLLLFWLLAAHSIGHFPTYGNPDPKELSIYCIFGPLIILLMNFWFFSIIPSLFLPIWLYFKTKKETYLIYFILGLFIHFITFLITATEIFEWFLD